MKMEVWKLEVIDTKEKMFFNIFSNISIKRRIKISHNPIFRPSKKPFLKAFLPYSKPIKNKNNIMPIKINVFVNLK